MSTSTTDRSSTKRRGILILAVVVTALVTFGLTALLINILQRQTEARQPYAQVVEITESTDDPAEWGKNFPAQYESYLKTSEMEGTKYAGSHAVEQEPTELDPRTIVATSRLEEDPRLKDMWAGYPFATDYRHARGHAYMLEDQRLTKRVTEFNQPGACLNCHASTVTVMNDLGNGDMMAGFHEMNKRPYLEITQMAEHPVSCLDCHDPETMALRITRPGLITGLAALKASEGIENYDVNRDATAQEMRSFVCAQCHVEYYFAGDEKTLTFPWTQGLEIEDIVAHYDSYDFVDWTHATTGATMLKAQHPEFDVWSQGVHASAGVSCADCHMPYVREGARKVTDHWLRSPLLDASASCGVCHTDDADTMIQRVYTIQDRYVAERDQTFDALVGLIRDLEAAQTNGTPEDRIALGREYQRLGSFYLDYVYSENSNGFHAPQYIMRILGDSRNFSRMGQLALQGMSREDIERQFEGTTIPYGGEEPGHANVVNPGLVDSGAVMKKVLESRASG